MNIAKNAIYSGCIIDPWIDVAKKLDYFHNIKPIYWIGWNNDKQEFLLKEEFPNIIFHDLSIAWKGIFPHEIEELKIPPLDGKILKENAFHELVAIKMMDRLDPDGRSFGFNERQRHYRHLLRHWLGVIDHYKFDLLISASIPHRVFDYVLYVACKLRGVKTIMYEFTSFNDLLIPTDNIYNMPIRLKDKYIANIHLPVSGVKPSESTLKQISILRSDYDQAEPYYMKNQKNTAKSRNIREKYFSTGFRPKILVKKVIGLTHDAKSYLKESKKTIEDSRFSKLDVKLLKERGKKYKNNLYRYYESVCVPFVKKDKYIFVALQYQPEETSCPSGGVYYDQLLIVENIAKNLPDNWKVYVKEHTSQFHFLLQGETSRDKNLYNDLLKIDKVKLISTKEISFNLIDNSQAVATITGTVGWEAILRGKPVLVFGNAWYKQCEGAFYVESASDVKKAIEAISDSYSIDKHKVLCFIKAVEDVGIRAYHYKGCRERSKVSHDDSVERLVQTIIEKSNK